MRLPVPMSDTQQRILYGRRRGRRLRPARQRLVDALLPRLNVDLSRAPADPRGWFGRAVREVWLEVGFGSGEHLAAQAAAYPDVGFIGCEPYLNGVAKLLTAIGEDGNDARLDTIRILMDDARPLLDHLAAGSLGRCFVLFPDPWPKTRHHRRRFIAPAQLDRLARLLAPGAELRIATDHMGYLRWILQHCLAHPDFEWLARRAADWRVRPFDWPPSRYEEKALARGAACVYLRFRRRAAGPEGGKPLPPKKAERPCRNGPERLNIRANTHTVEQSTE